MRKGNRPLLLLLALLLATLVFSAAWQRRAEKSAATAAPADETPPPVEEETVSALAGKLCISEIMIKNRAVVRDEDGDFSDWLELQNLSDETLTLGGCRLSDREDGAGWPLPDTALAPGGRLLLFASRKNRAGPELHTSFTLTDSDVLCLYDGRGLPVDRAACRPCAADVSLVPGADGGWEESLWPTPGEENSPAGYLLCQRRLEAAGPLALSEAMVRDEDGDWLELQNVSDAPVLLSDYYLSDKLSDLRRCRLPETELAPGAFLLLRCAQAGADYYGETPCTGFALNAEHEQLYLTSAAGLLCDYASLRGIPAGCSFGRMEGEAGFFYFAEPTPGAKNAGGKRRVSAQPLCLGEDGVFGGGEPVRLSFAGAGELRYTLNAAAPTEQSARYTDGVELRETGVLRVRCFEPDALPGPTLALSCFINEKHSLPILSLAADDPEAFAELLDTGDKGRALSASLALYRKEGGFRENCSVKLVGDAAAPTRCLAVRFGAPYGARKLDCDLFGGGTASFGSLLLVTGSERELLSGELARRLSQNADSAALTPRALLCELWLNGQCAGLCALRERADDMDGAECADAPAASGSALYADTVGFVRSHDMRLSASYEAFCRAVDPDSLIDWLLLEGYRGAEDPAAVRTRWVRSSAGDGRWRLLLASTDGAFHSPEAAQRLLDEGAAARNQASFTAAALLQNEVFRDRLLERAAALLAGPLTDEAAITALEDMRGELRGGEYAWLHTLYELRAAMQSRSWRQANLEGLCRALGLGAEERAAYFDQKEG